MLGILIDAGVLLLVIKAIQGDDAPEFLNILLVAAGMAVANFFVGLLLAPFVGFFALVPVIVVDGLILMYFCHLTLGQAGITLAIFLTYRVIFLIGAGLLMRAQ